MQRGLVDGRQLRDLNGTSGYKNLAFDLHILAQFFRNGAAASSSLRGWRRAAAQTAVLRLLGRDADPASSRQHVLLSVIAERRLLGGQNADLAALMQDVLEPPISEIGALPMNCDRRGGVDGGADVSASPDDDAPEALAGD